MADKTPGILPVTLEVIRCDKGDCTFSASGTTLKAARAAISEHKTYHDRQDQP